MVSEEKIFRNRPIRNKNCLWRPGLLTNRDEMSNLYRRPSIHAFYQISVHSEKWFQRRRFFINQPIRNKNGLWWPCLLMDQAKKKNMCVYGNQQQCFIYSTASFLSKLRAKKVEKLHNSSFYRNFRKLNTGIGKSDSGTGNDYFRFCR